MDALPLASYSERSVWLDHGYRGRQIFKVRLAGVSTLPIDLLKHRRTKTATILAANVNKQPKDLTLVHIVV